MNENKKIATSYDVGLYETYFLQWCCSMLEDISSGSEWLPSLANKIEWNKVKNE